MEECLEEPLGPLVWPAGMVEIGSERSAHLLLAGLGSMQVGPALPSAILAGGGKAAIN